VRPYSITQEQSQRHESKSTPSDFDIPVVPGRSRSRSDGMAARMVPGMQFFHFPGSEDGEDIKRRFKARYAEAESHLTESEKDDIVSEAQHIFSFMLGLISDLDLIMHTQDEDIETERLLYQSRPLVASRDSVAVTHERLSRRRSSSTDEYDAQRKSSFLKVLVIESLAKLVQFRSAVATWNLVMKPLGRRFSKDGPLLAPQVSFSPRGRTGHGASTFLVEHFLMMLVLLVSAFVALMAWYKSS